MTLVTGSNVGSRTYLMAPNNKDYQMFHLKNKEFTFDVDVSNLPCGVNGALYFVEMDQDGGLSEYANNKAGAAYGTGYCDSQCPQDIKFINGLVSEDFTSCTKFQCSNRFPGQHSELDPVFGRSKLRYWQPWLLLQRNGYLGSELHIRRFHASRLQQSRPNSVHQRHSMRRRYSSL